MERKYSVSAGSYYLLALMILLLPLQWIVAMLLSAIFHELCHFLAIRFVHQKVRRLQIESSATRICLPELTLGQELICALAGPAGSFFLLLFAEKFPRIALCGVVQGIYNMLPVYPLDGGRAVNCILAMTFSPPVAKIILSVLEVTVYLMIIAAGLYCFAILNLGFWTLGLSAMLLFRCFLEKSLANRRNWGYNSYSF